MSSLNPLNWVQSAQDWFIRAEKSSGFRPYLVYLFLAVCTGLTLIVISTNRPNVEMLGIFLIGISMLAFILIFAWKAITDPDFCRSEKHIQSMRKLEHETMGSESKQIQAAIWEQDSLTPPVKEFEAIGLASDEVAESNL